MKDSNLQTQSPRWVEALQNSDQPPQKPSRPTAPSHHDVAQRAFHIYEASGYQQGRCQENWRQAELELCRPRSETPERRDGVRREAASLSAEIEASAKPRIETASGKQS